MVIVVMGVTGSGKTTIGRLLASRLGAEFVEGDNFHPKSNIDKMSSGVPLSDDDRSEWLTRIATEVTRRKRVGTSGHTVISCSALKKKYRDRLREADSNLVLVYLAGSPELLARRLADRKGHFMPPQLLASQLATLQEPGSDEAPIVAEIDQSEDDIAAEVLHALRARLSISSTVDGMH